MRGNIRRRAKRHLDDSGLCRQGPGDRAQALRLTNGPRDEEGCRGSSRKPCPGPGNRSRPVGGPSDLVCIPGPLAGSLEGASEATNSLPLRRANPSSRKADPRRDPTHQASASSHRGALRAAEEAGLSGTTVLQIHRVLHAAFNQAVRWQLLDRNPADAVKAPRKSTLENAITDR